MPLRLNVEKVKDVETVCFTGEGENRRLHPITESLRDLGRNAGYSRITEANAAEVYRRVAILDELFGAPACHGDGSPWSVTEEDVRRHIGLTVNWSEKTKTQFNREVKAERDKR